MLELIVLTKSEPLLLRITNAISQLPNWRISIISESPPPRNIINGQSLILSNIICTESQNVKLIAMKIPITYITDDCSITVIKNILNLRELKIYESNSLTKKELNLNQKILIPREIEILNHIESGLTSKEIANLLFISKRTVDNHRQNMMNKKYSITPLKNKHEYN